MPCLAALLALIAPRFVIVVLVLFTDYLARAYDTFLWPLLGFFFLPTTTIAYAWAANTYDTVRGFALFVVVLAVLFDLGAFGGGGRSAARRR